jgi:hypothetical protein
MTAGQLRRPDISYGGYEGRGGDSLRHEDARRRHQIVVISVFTFTRVGIQLSTRPKESPSPRQ